MTVANTRCNKLKHWEITHIMKSDTFTGKRHLGFVKSNAQIQNHTKYNKQEKYSYDFNKKHTTKTKISHTNHRPVIEANMALSSFK